MMPATALLFLLTACGGGERFTEQQLAAEEIPEDPTTWTVEDNLPSMLRIEPGSFSMGSEAGTHGRTADETLHRVTITQPFALARTEVPQGLYRAVMGRNPSMTVGYDKRKMIGEKLPVQGLSFLDAVRFCNALSQRQGLEPAYAVDGVAVTWVRDADGYRLPTEAEWEYAATAGHGHRWAGAEEPAAACAVANVADQALARSDGFPCTDGHASKAPVGSLQPNAWGLHDMTGNVWEWVFDLYGPHPEVAVQDPIGPAQGAARVYKGGSWLDGPDASRAAARRHGDPGEISIQLGFRLARSIPTLAAP
jgi:sulfatase modifying factor 1